MNESILQEVDKIFQGRAFLSVEDIAVLLNCSESVIYNWTRRSNPKRRPPKVIVGKSIRFPKKEFVKWLTEQQR